jgi:hypothetical protein
MTGKIMGIIHVGLAIIIALSMMVVLILLVKKDLKEKGKNWFLSHEKDLKYDSSILPI